MFKNRIFIITLQIKEENNMPRTLQHSEKKHNLYLDLARRIAQESYCKRLQVGAVIVKDGNIISFGYNGTPSGLPNVCEENNVTLPTVLHAESNAITKACKSPISTQGATIYMTHSCCVECAKLIIQSGITKVYYLKDYRDMKGIDLLRNCHIDVVKTNNIETI
jgi:dCMP deaminase